MVGMSAIVSEAALRDPKAQEIRKDSGTGCAARRLPLRDAVRPCGSFLPCVLVVKSKVAKTSDLGASRATSGHLQHLDLQAPVRQVIIGHRRPVSLQRPNAVELLEVPRIFPFPRSTQHVDHIYLLPGEATLSRRENVEASQDLTLSRLGC